MAIRLFIVDDHSLIIEGLRSALQHEQDIEVVGHAVNAVSCRSFFEGNTADVVLMDINLPDGNGIDLCTDLLITHPYLKIIALSTFSQRSYVSKMMENGARGYILKNTDIVEIHEAIRQAYKGNIFISKEAGNTLYKPQSSNDADEVLPLTRREKEVLKFIAEGFTAPEIAEKLFVSQLTIESHRRNLMAKLKAKNTAVLIKIAMDRCLI
ncbi:response regulator [Chryseosolibacter indicus]|uniref:Response regulator transcription factor n=1 Tax=Chryseosolibacter indicus TaxID=2782351 RepID=A0ABS5VU91_9BACT|nr:response regulator transcription factor [Chryseosolibacter indicus]MBT1704633.1 response regulator transcription factor [Chryseosolibacter indicus]